MTNWDNFRHWSRGSEFDAYMDGTLSSEAGPGPRLFSLGASPELEPKTGCPYDGLPSVDRLTHFCAWHQAHHGKRVEVYQGTISREEYEAWYEKHKKDFGSVEGTDLDR